MFKATAKSKRVIPGTVYGAIADLPGCQAYYAAALEGMEIHARKNADYRGDEIDPLYNFSMAAAMSGLTPRQVFRSEQAKKFARLTVLTKSENPAINESHTDTLQDLSNYFLLELAYEESYPDFIDTPMTMGAVSTIHGITVEQHLAEVERNG